MLLFISYSLNKELRQESHDDFPHNRIMIEGNLLHFANGSQKACFSVNSSILQRSFQRTKNGVLIFTQFSTERTQLRLLMHIDKIEQYVVGMWEEQQRLLSNIKQQFMDTRIIFQFCSLKNCV